MNEAPEFTNALRNLQEAYVEGLKAFVVWLEDEWQHDTPDAWRRSTDAPWPGDSYQDGWNACLASIEGALEMFMDEHRL